MSKVRMPPTVPTSQNMAEDFRPAPRPPSRRVRRSPDDVAELKRRASKASAEARSGVNLTVRVSVAVYKAIVELAEQYHQPVAAVARQALQDGVRKYKDFRDPTLNNPFMESTPLAKYPGLVRAPQPPATIERLFAQARQQAPATPEETSILETDLVQEALKRISIDKLLPSSPERVAPVEEPSESIQSDIEPGPTVSNYTDDNAPASD